MKTKNAFWIAAALLFVFFAQVLPAQAQDAPPELPPGVIANEQQLQQGWNLPYNPFVFALNVANYFGSYGQQTSASWTTETLWTWNNATSKWRFWSPQLTVAENAQYAQDKGYELLVDIQPGEGYWLLSKYNTNLPRIVGEPFVRTAENFAALPAGWNLIGGDGSPSQFNRAMNPTPVDQCMVPTGNFTTLWAWDAGAAKWIFYAPQLEALGGSATWDYTQAKGYYDGTYWQFQRVGQWVNIPPVKGPPVPRSDCYARG